MGFFFSSDVIQDETVNKVLNAVLNATSFAALDPAIQESLITKYRSLQSPLVNNATPPTPLAGQPPVVEPPLKVSIPLDEAYPDEEPLSRGAPPTPPSHINSHTVAHNRPSLKQTLEIYSPKVRAINAHLFPYLNDDQITLYLQEVFFAFLILVAQFELDEAENRRQDRQESVQLINKCVELMEQLQTVARGRIPDLTLDPPYKTEPLQVVNSGFTPDVLHLIGAVNGRRLYWIWSKELLASAISRVPPNFYHQPHAANVIGSPSISMAMGYMSFGLYIFRFCMNASLLAKHTFEGWWMSLEEKKIPQSRRFDAAFQELKLSLINDFLWTGANLSCFFWLIDKPLLVTVGNVLTAVLLTVDILVTIYRLYKEKHLHDQNIARYDNDIREIKEKINRAQADSQANSEELALIIKQTSLLQLQLISLEKDKQQCQLDWKYKKAGIYNDLAYSAGLLVAFSLLVFCPPAMLIGAALCFGFTIAYAANSAWIARTKSKELAQIARTEAQKLLQDFINNKDPSEQERKALYLRRQQLLSTARYHERMAGFQEWVIARSVLVDALFPAAVFSMFLFVGLSFGVGLAVIAGLVVLAAFSHWLLNKNAPKPESLPEFDGAAYSEFKLGLKEDVIPQQKNAHQAKWFDFFSKSNASTAKSQDEPQANAKEALLEQNPVSDNDQIYILP